MLGGGLRDVHLELAHGQLRHLRMLLARIGRAVLGAVDEVRIHLVVDLPGADVRLRAPHLRVVHVGARQQQHEAGGLAVGHWQRVDLFLRDHLRDFSPGHFDDRRLAGDRDGLLQRLHLHGDVLLQSEADGDGQPIDRHGRKSLQLCLQLVGPRLQSGKAIRPVGFARDRSLDAGIDVAQRQRHAGQNAALRIRHGALNLPDHLRVHGQRESNQQCESHQNLEHLRSPLVKRGD